MLQMIGQRAYLSAELNYFRTTIGHQYLDALPCKNVAGSTSTLTAT